MKLSEIFSEINSSAERFLEKDKSGRGYICPVCKSGSGPNGTGITENPKLPGHFTCWSGRCFSNASVADILAIKNGIDTSDKRAVAENSARLLGIFPEKQIGFPYKTQTQKQTQERQERMKEKNGNETSENEETNEIQNDEDEDFSEFFRKCHGNIEETDYWKKRGLSKEIIDRFNIGFCKGWKHPKTPSAPPTDRLIIPTGNRSYLARATEETNGKYAKQKVGKTALFNIGSLSRGNGCIFVVEGEIDAMSVIMAGGNAIALGSLSMTEKFIDAAKESDARRPLIIALDNDKNGSGAGNRAQEKIMERKDEFLKGGIFVHFADVERLFIGKKDANEALCMDSAEFCKRIREAEEKAFLERKNETEKDSAFSYIPQFIRNIQDSSFRNYTPTGFRKLDEELDGGLFPGLYVIGAISSLGKTTFCLQVADQIASETERDVMIFSLEMSKDELIAKSLSRLSADESMKTKGDFSLAKSTRGILTGSRYEKYSEEEKNAIGKSIDEYKSFSSRIFIYETGAETTVGTIRSRVERHTQMKGEPPIVIIDYLQIIDPPGGGSGLTDKQITDRNVKALKIMSRDFSTTVIGISSFNRDNYSSSVNMSSFKESGAIEYSSDVLIGLQYKEMSEISADKDGRTKAKAIAEKVAKDAREMKPISVQLKILKNRNGNKGNIDFDFYPVFNRFSESGDQNEKWIRK